ncbi:MAG: twin-arginine translocase TatA/TatE family subunit [Kiritimatiellae bacterium]|nr:twin-arginine translocase TatA/TatE family subunit [Kiritimatiellia bacterium]
MSVLAFLGGSLGGGEVTLILFVALLLFGSKNLPQVARMIGKTMEQIRRAANDVRDEVMKAELEEEKPEKKSDPEPEHGVPVPRPPKEDADDRVAR